MLYLVAALAITAISAPSRSSGLPHKTLIVQLVHRVGANPHRVSNGILALMRKETERIWVPLDVRIEWVDSGGGLLAHPAGLTVFLEEGDDPAPAGRALVLATLNPPDVSCGWGLAHVWVRRVEHYAAQVRRGDHATLPAAMAEILLGRALGRALAHEIGHFLLDTREHSTHGLMRAEFTPLDLLEEATRPLYRLDPAAQAGLVSCRTEEAAESDDRQ